MSKKNKALEKCLIFLLFFKKFILKIELPEIFKAFFLREFQQLYIIQRVSLKNENASTLFDVFNIFRSRNLPFCQSAFLSTHYPFLFTASP